MNCDCRYYIRNISLASPDAGMQHTQKSFFLFSLISLLHVSFTGTRFFNEVLFSMAVRGSEGSL